MQFGGPSFCSTRSNNLQSTILYPLGRVPPSSELDNKHKRIARDEREEREERNEMDEEVENFNQDYIPQSRVDISFLFIINYLYSLFYSVEDSWFYILKKGKLSVSTTAQLLIKND